MRKFLIGLLITSLFLCEVSYGAVQWTKYAYFKNFGGLNDSQSTTEIADNEATDLQNVIFDVGGAIKKRNGYDIIPDNPDSISTTISTGSSQGITGLQFWKRNNATRSLLAIVNNDGAVLAYANGAPSGSTFPSTSWIEVTPRYGGALPSTGQTNNDLVDFTIGEDTLVFTMGARSPPKPFMYQATGSTAQLTNDTDCPTASLCEYHKNHLFLAGNTTYPSRVYFSALGNIYDWTATDFFNVETNDGTQVRALISAYDSLYIFKDNSIWRLSGTNRDDFVLQLMVKNVGTLSFNSVKLLKDGIFFTTAQGDIAAYDGGYNVVFISSKIRNTIGGLNFSRAMYSVGAAYSTYRYNDYDYYCGVSQAGKSANDTMLLFDTEKKAWTKFSGLTPSVITVGETSSGHDRLFFGDNAGYVHSYPTTDYIDNNIISLVPNMTLLSHFDGTDAAASYTAETGQSFTFVGTAQLDTAQYKFGTASLLLDGNSDYVTLPHSADWDFAAGDFTIDCWVRFSVDENTVFASQWDAAPDSAWIFGYNSSTLRFLWSTNGTDSVEKNVTWTPTINVWYHVAVVRNGNDLKFFVNGIQIGTTQDITGVTIFNSGAILYVGAYSGGGFLPGWIDELRISKGIARWTANFTPETSAYTISSVNQSSINSYYQTKWFIYPELALSNKIWRRCKPYFISESGGSTVNIECKADYEATGTTFAIDLGFGSSLWDNAIFDTAIWGGQSLITKLLEVEKGYSMFQIKFSNANLNEGFTLLGFENFLESTSGGV